MSGLTSGELAMLRSLMGKLSLGASPKKRGKKKRSRKKNSSPAYVPAGMPQPLIIQGARRKRKGRASNNIGSSGEVVLSRTELLAQVDIKENTASSAVSVSIYPDSSVLTWLHKVSAAFDRIIWLKARVHWKPCVGTMKNGSIVFGVDWNSSLTAVKRESVQALTPVSEVPVWQSMQLALPADRLMSRKSYSLNSTQMDERQPGLFCYHVKCDATSAAQTVGDFWLEYTVRLQGTQT